VPPARWSLSARPRFDLEGRFDGYTGTATPLAPAQPAANVQPAAALRSGPGVLPEALPAPAPTVAAQVEAEASQAAADRADQESFIYTISHDLRAPIRVVDGFARILKEDYGRFLDRIGNDHVDRVLAAAARMNSMIDALLALSRLQSQPLQRQPVDLSQLAHYILEDLQREAPEREADLRIEPGIVVQGDPTLLRIALENLLGNAWKYSGKCTRTQIDFRRESRNGSAALMVGDNGAGFDMRFSDRLFGVFQRLHSAKDFQGTGVGLASVRRIVRRHGGDIWAESEVGSGARFFFTLTH
jgi:light-regulated signal transduction histidine kinase (bacteriophytochrome)